MNLRARIVDDMSHGYTAPDIIATVLRRLEENGVDLDKQVPPEVWDDDKLAPEPSLD